MGDQLNELRLLYLRENLTKLEDSLLELQKALAELAAKPVAKPSDAAIDDDAQCQNRTMYTGTTFEAAMRAIPPNSTIDSIERRDEGWIVKIADR
ncbi:hypothetical protein [Geobacter sp. SVR]|uniref:hypothetical protein n=1 Tax=Geobacter sp. SVR TaxID=2495594 RepID=UPI00143EFF62|nr:hypothetical protein [Geobacter sp. SVR]BCS52090.1 hypothetical protein GSVR_03980 [Geobacter sp. SVR]GCF86545.1 hypothetical protein GSbR_31450 [Geobacter sp. SVR]